jgi:uncharacterized protein YndB with AHSA1/START domain
MNERATLHASFIAPATIRMERLLPGPVERLWAYLTDSKKRATWFAGGEFELRVGGRVELQFDHNSLSKDRDIPDKYKGVEHSRLEGRITRLEPNRVLAYTWNMGEQGSEVTFELSPRGKDVLLTITHTGLTARDMQVGVMSGWDVHTGILADVLAGVEPRPFWSTHSRLEKQYQASV